MPRLSSSQLLNNAEKNIKGTLLMSKLLNNLEKTLKRNSTYKQTVEKNKNETLLTSK